MAPVEARAQQCQVTHTASDARLCFVEAAPAPWPYSRVVNKKELGLEAASEVIARTVTPEAQKYFHRIVQVAQSELEKLLVNKVQHIFDPVAAHSLKGVPVGMEGGSRRATLDKAASLNDPQKCKTKSAVEGQQLTAYVASVLGRIMVDFSRFADTILRWQCDPCKGGENVASNKQLCASSPQSCSEYQDTLEDLVKRLERQDKVNTELEDKYSNVMAELRQRKREFIRERAVFKERLRMLQAYARESGDKALTQIMTHDVQFYGEGGVSVEDVKDEYERKLQDQQTMFQRKLRQKDEKYQELNNEFERVKEAFEDLKKRKQNDNTANLESKLAKTEQALEDAEEALQKALEENETLKVANDGLLMQVESLKNVLDGIKRQLHEQAAEASMTEKQLRAELADLQARLLAAQTQAAHDRSMREEPPKPRCSRQFLRELSQSVAPDDRFERMQAELLAARADLESLRSSSEDEAEKLRQALRAAATAAPKGEVAETASQSDAWEPNKEDLAAAMAREAELLQQLAALRSESQSLASALEAFKKAASAPTVTRNIGCGDESILGSPPVPVVHRQLLPNGDSDLPSSGIESIPGPLPESKVDPPIRYSGMTEEELRAMFDYPRVMTLGGGWLQGRRAQRPAGQSFPTAQYDRYPSPDQSGSPDFARSGSPQHTWPASRMPPELTSTGLGRGRSPSPGADFPAPLLLPLTAKAKRSTVCSSPPPPGSKAETWPPPRAHSPDQAMYETQAHQQDYHSPEDSAPLSRGPAWRSKISRSGHPLGPPSSASVAHKLQTVTSNVPGESDEASDMFVAGERPPSAGLASRLVRSRPTTAKPVQGGLASLEPPAAETASEKKRDRPSTAGRVANIDLSSCIAELPEPPRSGMLGAQRNAEQPRSTYGGGFVLLAPDGSSRRQASRASEATRGRDPPTQQSEIEGGERERPCIASQISRPSSAARGGLAGRMRRGDGTKSATQLDKLGPGRAAGALRPAMARRLSEQSLP
eukprot:TRINITY_DN33276_c0_g1_i1.p1 TRINITY_DN33276_c0_g1~~TRINITY_DN33276_c0_g1_i1.p1  ORF type:complete len:997 (+),score=208.85 TRINITY_DN33276_c0_g1_i1:135-3125(+)